MSEETAAPPFASLFHSALAEVARFSWTNRYMTRLSLILAGNEPRQRYLFEALASRLHVPTVLEFDDIDPITKLTAAVLSLSWPRSEWWENYQMHPLVQSRRRRVLSRGLHALDDDVDALLMWGSWFKPPALRSQELPFFNYIDQSHSLRNLPGERKGRFARRARAHALQGATYDAAAGIFCMSEWARNQTLESHRVDAGKVVAVGWGPCGVDLSVENFTSVEREPVVLHVSNDFYRKGLDFLFATAERVHAAVPSARFVVIGEDVGGRRPSSPNYVMLLGRISDKQILADHFRRASAFFLPHRFDRSPHVLVEAMSAALPLVASAQGGAIELIEGTGAGYLVKSGDIQGYTDAIVSVLRDQDLRQTMGMKSQELMR
ncbi:MAG: glycosyltransferase family 4 protein, partial [Steroidobacteraceae bacterium]